jgi:1,4-alpha-glucan branching enzyme
MTKCHIDGFRYDCVPNYWDGPTGVGYANLVYETSKLGGPSLIQCAEQLEDPKGVVWQTYSNSTWQDETLGAAKAVAHGDRDRLYDLGMRLGLDGYPDEVKQNQETLLKSAFQYLENHDHSRFLTEFGILREDDRLFDKADRSKWYKAQPYLIALFAAKGIPLLWQGQELGADNVMPERGFARIGVLRPMPWELFYDDYGRGILGLVRKLTRIRRANSELQHGDYYFYNDWAAYQSAGALLFSRSTPAGFTLAAMNFTDTDISVDFAFSRSGTYTELLHGQDVFIANMGDQRRLTIPSNYGRLWRTH